MLVSKYIEIDMGHRVMNHKSKCRNFHGHRYKIQVGVDDKVINSKGSSDEGMVIDFGDLKTIMMNVIDAGFDHGFCISSDDMFIQHFLSFKERGLKVIIVDFVPTAENLCKYWFNLIRSELVKKGINLEYVKVWETPTSTAICYKRDVDI